MKTPAQGSSKSNLCLILTDLCFAWHFQRIFPHWVAIWHSSAHKDVFGEACDLLRCMCLTVLRRIISQLAGLVVDDHRMTVVQYFPLF